MRMHANDTNKMKLALLDFDDVLFNTRAFVEEVKNIFISAGLSEEEHGRIHEEMRERFVTESAVYDQDKHIDFFCARAPALNKNDLKKELGRANKKIPSFTYTETPEFLENLSENGWKKIILTFGNDEWQRKKIYESGVGALADEVVVSPEPTKVGKAREILERHLGASDIVFIDDNPYRALNMVKAEFPRIRTIQLIRPELEYKREWHKGCDHNCRSLDEVQKLLLP